MWGNVLGQTGSRLGQRAAHTTTPNLILEPKTGSIYIKKQKVTESGFEQDL